jgi:PAS domain S-box-containing protein
VGMLGPAATTGSRVGRFLADAAPDGLVVADETGIIRFVNRRLEELVGRSRNELVGMPVEALVPADLSASHRSRREAPAADAAAMIRGVETRLATEGGRSIPVELSVATEDAGDGRLTIITIRDARDRRRSAGATEGGRRRLTELYEAVPVAILGLDRSGAITYANPHLGSLVGLCLETAAGSDGLGLLLGERADPRAAYLEILGQVTSTYHEARVWGAEGRSRIFGWHTVPVHGDEGDVVGSLSIGEDLTSRRRSEAALDAIQEVGNAVLRGESTARVEQLVCNAARDLLDVPFAVLARPGASGCEVTAVSGAIGDGFLGRPVSAPWCSAATAEPRVIVHETFADFAADGLRFGPTVVAPLAEPPSCGFLLVADAEGAGLFDDESVETVRGFSGQANVVLEYGNRLRELAVAEDRERIARDLHDLVIQRIFSAGLTLQVASQMVQDRPEAATRLADVAESLDVAIVELRRSILGLEEREPTVFRLRIEEAIADMTAGTGFIVDLDVPADIGPIPEVLQRNLIATLREALANAVRHAAADRVRISIAAGDALVLVVEDDGIGFEGRPEAGHGLKNLADRASALGGALHLSGGAAGGVRLEWRVPLAAVR